MLQQHLLQSMAQQFNQTGVSVWIDRDGFIQQLLAMDSSGPSRQEVFEAFQAKVRWVKQKNYNMVRLEEMMIVFEGTAGVEPDRLIHYVDEHADWFRLLTDYAVKNRREKSLHLLIETAQTIVSSIQREDVLDIIITSAIDAIPSADTGFLFLYDEQMNKLLVKSAVGFREEKYRLTRLSPKEGISGTVFHTGQAVVINGEEDIKEAMANMSQANLQYYLDSTIHADYPYSVVSIPLIFESRRIGVMTINNFTKDAVFTDDDVMDLKALANHIAIAITQMNLFQKEREQRQELMLIHEALHKEHQRLQKSTDLHNTLTNLAARGKGISAILDGLHRIVGIPVGVYDSLLADVALSPDAVERELPADFFQQQPVQLMLQTKKWQRLQRESDSLIIIPVIGADKLLGFLCAWVEHDRMVDNQTFLLEYGATVLALEWTKNEAVRLTQERLKGEMIEQLLAGEINQTMTQRAKQLGLEPQHRYAVLLIRPTKEVEGDREQRFQSKWMREVQQYVDVHQLSGVVLHYDIYVMVLLSFHQDEAELDIADKVRQMIYQLKGNLANGQLTSGRLYEGLMHVHQSYGEAKKCMELLDRHMLDTNVLNFQDIGAYRFFLQQEKEELEGYVKDTLGRLIEYDDKKNSAFLYTLLLYVQHDRNIKALAQELDVHYNTLYYRLHRMEEILAVSFEDSETWFNIQLACRVYQYIYQIALNNNASPRGH